MFNKKIVAGISALALLTNSCMTNVITTFADSAPIATIGADLTEEQKQTIYNFFGISPDTTQVIEINNQQERQYLEGKIADSVIGTKTLSCSYIMPTTSGGIVVKTANLTYVTEGMLANALLTCGITDCQVLATAPFKVSGTGALTGVMTAYEQSAETTLDEDKKQLATEELILTGEIIDEVVTEEPIILATDSTGETIDETSESKDAYQQITEQQILAILNDIKIEIINGNLSEDKIKEILDKHLEEYKIQLTEETYNRLVAYLTELSKVNYADTIKEKLSETTERITGGFDITTIADKVNVSVDIDFKTDKNSIEQFFINIINFIKYLFGDVAEQASEQASGIANQASSIFSSINTDVFQYDTPVEDENTETTVEDENVATPVEDENSYNAEDINNDNAEGVNNEENADGEEIIPEEQIYTDGVMME